MLINGIRIVSEAEAKAKTRNAWRQFDACERARQRFFRLVVLAAAAAIVDLAVWHLVK
jgi:hypothetical protein